MKKIVITFVILVLVVIGYSAWQHFYDWKTYTNTPYGITFRYPREFSVYAKTPEGGNDEIWLILASTTNQNSNSLLDIAISKQGAGNSLEESYRSQKPSFQGEYFATQPIQLGTQTTTAYLRFIPNPPDECYGISLIVGSCLDQFSIVHSENTYDFVISGLLENKEISPRVKTILSSFKFTK